MSASSCSLLEVGVIWVEATTSASNTQRSITLTLQLSQHYLPDHPLPSHLLLQTACEWLGTASAPLLTSVAKLDAMEEIQVRFPIRNFLEMGTVEESLSLS